MDIPKSVAEWQHTSYLYEECLFFYGIITGLWWFISIFAISARLPDVSLMTYFWTKFAIMLFFCIIMCFPAFWYRLIFGKNAYLFREERKYQSILNQADESNRATIKAILHENGARLFNRTEQIALGFLFSMILFQLFCGYIWVGKNKTLIWQPEWVTACIDWVRSYVNTEPYYKSGRWGLFEFQFGDSPIEQALKQEYGTEVQFLQSPKGYALLFQHFIRTITFIPTIAAICIVLWQPFQFMGNGDKDPSNIHSIMGFIRACAWSIVMGFFGLGLSLALINSVDYSWNGDRDAMVTAGFYFFIAIAVRFFSGWFIFWKRVLFKLLGVVHHGKSRTTKAK